MSCSKMGNNVTKVHMVKYNNRVHKYTYKGGYFTGFTKGSA